MPVLFAGDTLELRGWIATQDVEGFAGLWLGENDSTGSIQRDNMEERGLDGTTAWAEYRIALPLDKRAKSVAFGALLQGQGKAWVDDLQLLVDGRPMVSVLDTDHEFDAGSRIDATPLSKIQVENLVLLAKVWGLLKYHHPRVTTGKLHWDYELFRVLPPVLGARSSKEAANVLYRWLDRVGDPEPCKPCAALPDSAYLQSPTGWIRDRGKLGGALSERLQRVYVNRSEDSEQPYVTYVRRPDFSSEAEYADAPLDAGYRLLALFRFWNIIEYWFPYRDLIDENWDAVLAEFVPRVMAASTLDDYRLAMIALVARVDDTHACVLNALETPPPGGRCQLPVALRAVESKFVVGDFSDSLRGPASGLEIGDVFLELDGRSVDSLASVCAPYYGGSNATVRVRNIARNLTRGGCGACRVQIERDGRRLTVTSVRDSSRSLTVDSRAFTPHDLPGATFRLLSKDVAYLKLSSVVAKDVPTYLEKAAGTRCFVIDIRGYPSDFMPYVLGGHLVERPTPFARFIRGDPSNPGAFLWNPPVVIQPQGPRYTGTVVILVDEMSQSQSEFTAMAFRAVPGALVVGSTTSGADGDVSAIPLPGGLSARISGIGVFYPDKSPTQQIGIVPDLEVRPTIAGIRAGRDEVLEAAIERILGQKWIMPSGRR
jgi:hypothetical protein